jgi:hypothetical protein
MFELTDEQEIRDNISFFVKIIKLSTTPDKEKRLSIALYKGMVERMQSRTLQPFPIQMSEIEDKDLKSTILQINQSFSNMLLGSIESIDIDGCDGEQALLVDDENVTDDKYYELFSTLLIPCYSSDVFLDGRILTGRKAAGKHIGDNCVLNCECEQHKYFKECRFIDVNDIISQKDQAIERMKKLVREIEITDTVEAVMGDHHNHVQADGKKFNSLDDLSSQNKIVLRLLRELGLFKVIFGRFLPQGVRAAGTLSIQSLEEKETQDILVVKFSAETKMLIETSLYFPKGVGNLLSQYFQNQQLTYMNVNELIEKIK